MIESRGSNKMFNGKSLPRIVFWIEVCIRVYFRVRNKHLRVVYCFYGCEANMVRARQASHLAWGSGGEGRSTWKGLQP